MTLNSVPASQTLPSQERILRPVCVVLPRVPRTLCLLGKCSTNSRSFLILRQSLCVALAWPKRS